MAQTIAQTIQMTPKMTVQSDSPGIIKRSVVLLYGVASYGIGVTGLMWIFLAMGGFSPVGFGPLKTETLLGAITIDFGLIALFGLQHSVMARNAFKRKLKTILPAAVERSTYVMFSGVFMSLAIYLWQPLPGAVWVVENQTAQYALWALYAAGWSYLFVATFITNHFELMGLRQVYLYFINKPYTTLPFVKKYMYRYSRHPMMLGILVGMWALPVMSVSHFIMAVLLTLYIIAGVFLEERDLVKQFGRTYQAYKKDVAALIPKMM
ncbi:methyltransferase [Kaarinaea lacus]